MKRILCLSDTHGYIDERIAAYCEAADEIWHAGDFGTLAVAETLEKIRPLRAVHGNIDGQDVRRRFPETNRFRCEAVDVMITHIAGRPEHYTQYVRNVMQAEPPRVLVCGHSHLLLVTFVKKYNVLHLNPGAAGNHGFHSKRTMLRFAIDGTSISGMEIIELGNRSVSGAGRRT
jgi:uncharacterized protein